MLKPDERRVLELIREFGPLKRDQLTRYFSGLMKGDLKRLLKGLRSRGYLWYDETSCKLYPAGWHGGENDAMVQAFYVYLEFGGSYGQIYRARPPGQIFFLRESNLYEIVTVPDGMEAAVVSQLKEAGNDETQYIFVLDNTAQAARITCPRLLAVCTVNAGRVTAYIEEADNET